MTRWPCRSARRCLSTGSSLACRRLCRRRPRTPGSRRRQPLPTPRSHCMSQRRCPSIASHPGRRPRDSLPRTRTQREAPKSPPPCTSARHCPGIVSSQGDCNCRPVPSLPRRWTPNWFRCPTPSQSRLRRSTLSFPRTPSCWRRSRRSRCSDPSWVQILGKARTPCPQPPHRCLRCSRSSCRIRPRWQRVPQARARRDSCVPPHSQSCHRWAGQSRHARHVLRSRARRPGRSRPPRRRSTWRTAKGAAGAELSRDWRRVPVPETWPRRRPGIARGCAARVGSPTDVYFGRGAQRVELFVGCGCYGQHWQGAHHQAPPLQVQGKHPLPHI
jgi:hypothetical protein